MNSRELQSKVTSDSGIASSLASSDAVPQTIVEKLYLATFSRMPTDAEREFAVGLFSSDDKSERRRVTEDLMWALLNTPEFMFKD